MIYFSFQETFKTLFWDLFGYGDPENADVVVSNTCPPPNVDVQCFNTSEHNFTEAVGFTIYGVYHIVAIIILLNMLIALMSNTLSRIQVRFIAFFPQKALILCYYEDTLYVFNSPQLHKKEINYLKIFVCNNLNSVQLIY